MIITSVEPTRDKKMMRIFIDNHYAFSIPQEDYIRNHLYEKEEINEEQLIHIRQEVLIRAARERAVRYLLAKDRSEGEVIRKLLDVGFDSDVANSTVESLKSIGYIDDSRYARKYMAERVRAKALSKRALRLELERKQISPEIIDEVLSEFEIDDEKIAFRAARKKFGKYDLKDRKVQQKLLRFLCHRGFSLETGQKVLKCMLSD